MDAGGGDSGDAPGGRGGQRPCWVGVAACARASSGGQAVNVAARGRASSVPALCCCVSAVPPPPVFPPAALFFFLFLQSRRCRCVGGQASWPPLSSSRSRLVVHDTRPGVPLPPRTLPAACSNACMRRQADARARAAGARWRTGRARSRHDGATSGAAERCAQGLALHGRGQWGQALNVFAGAVGDELASGLTGM